MSTDPAADASLPAERTSLAWRRLALTLLALVLVILRVAAPGLEVPALLIAALVCVGSVTLLVAGELRYRATLHAPRTDQSPPRRDGVLPLLTTGLVLFLGAIALLAALTPH